MLPAELERLLGDKLKALPEEGQQLVGIISLYYEAMLQKLESRIKELEDQQSRNSRNSNKPPSRDGLKKPSPQRLRQKSQREPGGQKGHKGFNLEMSSSVDETIVHQVGRCTSCGRDLSRQKVEDHVRRQVYDMPKPKVLLIEHCAEVKTCRCGCRNEGVFPAYVPHYVQWGPNVKSLSAYMQQEQLLPYDRTQQFLADWFGVRLSQGTLRNIQQQAYERLEDFEQRLKQLL